jgi:hypothetical protein
VPGPLDRAAYPYPLPPVGSPLRVAFVGPPVTLQLCVPQGPVPGIVPALIDSRPSEDPQELRTALAAAAPHVVVAFGPHSIPGALLRAIDAVTLGVAPDAAAVAGATGYDRVLALPGAAAEDAAVWRSRPLPVADAFFAPVCVTGRPPRTLFLGASTEYRERFLVDAKHRHDVLHYAHGLSGDVLRDVLSRVDVGVNVHADGAPAFEHRVLLHLAAGHLLLTEPLRPTYSLEPEIDYIPIARSDELLTVLHQLERRPRLHERVRLMGRAKADAHRASRVWPRLLTDLLDDVAAFGSDRVTAPPRSAAPAG